jgi:hypothetical protein
VRDIPATRGDRLHLLAAAQRDERIVRIGRRVLGRRSHIAARHLAAADADNGGLVLVSLDGLGKIGAGLVPGNVNMPLHDVADLGILRGGIGALLLGYALWYVARWQAVGFLAVGGAGTAGLVVIAAAPAHHLPAGAFTGGLVRLSAL